MTVATTLTRGWRPGPCGLSEEATNFEAIAQASAEALQTRGQIAVAGDFGLARYQGR